MKYENNMTIVNEGTSSFTQISNEILENENLQLDEKALFCILVKMGEGWQFRAKDIQKRAGVGKDKYQRIISNLKKEGFLEVDKNYDDLGRFTWSKWKVYNNIITDAALTSIGQADDGLTVAGQPSNIYNTRAKKTLDKENTNKKEVRKKEKLKTKRDLANEILDNYNSVRERDGVKLSQVRKLTDARISMINSTVNQLGKEDVLKIAEIASRSKFLQGKESGINPAHKNWKPTFDWLYKVNNAVKILEGNYGGLENKRFTSAAKNNDVNKTRGMRMIDSYMSTGVWPDAILGPVPIDPQGRVKKSNFSKLTDSEYNYLESEINSKKKID